MKCISGLVIILSLFVFTAYAQEEAEVAEAKEIFPKTGYVKDNGVMIKAGDNANFENLCSLLKSEQVKIIEKRYSWFKILLPKKAALYVSKDYVTLTSDEKGIGIINANNVNLRAGSGTRYSVIGQVSKPEKIFILSEDSGWYKIEPPYGTTGWVLSSQVNLAEEDIQTKKQEQNNPESEKKEKPGSIAVKLGANHVSSKDNLPASTLTKNNR